LLLLYFFSFLCFSTILVNKDDQCSVDVVTEVVAFTEQLQKAEQLARVVGVEQVLGLRRAVRNSETFGLVTPLKRVQIQHAVTAESLSTD